MKKSWEYNSNTNIDKSSLSVISKNSRHTKKNPEVESNDQQPIYFHKNTIGDRVYERTSKSKNKQMNEDKHLNKAGKIIQDLMNRHKNAKVKLQKLKDQCEKDHDKKCPFTPMKSCVQRYQIGSDVIRRNQIWLREKKRKQLQLKQTVTLYDLKQCTFSPSFSSKKASTSYLKERESLQTISPKNKHFKTRNSPSPFRSKKDYSEAEYEMAKRNLISKMMNSLG